MLDIETDFFTLYKSVDAICRDMFIGEHHYNEKGEEVFGISAYIRIMEKEDYFVRAHFPEWKQVYQTLKHLRWIRSQIAHSTDVSECNGSDLDDLESFYQQIMNQTDILARARRFKEAKERANRPSASKGPQHVQVPYLPTTDYDPSPRREGRRALTWLLVFVIMTALLTVAIVCYRLLS